MNKVLLSIMLLISGLSLASIVNAASGAYSPIHLQHLKNCSPYTEIYRTQIQTGDETSPYINLESVESVNGWLNGKCITESEIRSMELGGQRVFRAKCALSKQQLSSLIEKMNIINSQDNEETRQQLQEELFNFMKDNKTCNVKNYLEEQTE